MANTNSFETSDHVKLKGQVTGVTRISKKVKLLFMAGGVALLCFLIFAIFTIDNSGTDTGSHEPSAEEQEAEKPRGNDEPATGAAITQGVSNGNAAITSGSPTIDVAGIQTGGAGESASGGASPAVTLPGTMVQGGASGAVVAASTTGAGNPPGVVVPAPGGSAGQPLTPQQLAEQRKQDRLAQQEQAKLRLEDLRAQQRDAAMKSGTEVSGAGWDGSGDKGSGGGAPGSQLFSALQSGTGGAAGAGIGSGGTAGFTVPQVQMQDQDDQNKQGRKEAFLREAEAKTGQYYLRETRQRPISKYEVKMGWKIPAFLLDGINSDLPGQVCAQVRETVYDSATGKYPLIPQGAKVCGTYDSQIAVGQKRILMVWNRIIFDDSSSLTLGGMPGADQAGYAGFDAEVDNHYFKVFTSALMMSVISAGVQLSQPQQTNTNGSPTAGQTAAGALGQQLGQLTSGIIQRDLKIQPTLSQQPGYRFNIQVTRDIVFPAPYKRLSAY